MKKLITILTAINLISGSSCAVVACNSKINNNEKKARFINLHESVLTPSKKKASKINPAKRKASKILPSSPKATTIKPSNPLTGDATSIGHKIENRTIGLHGSFWLGKDIFEYHQQLADAIVEQGLLTRAEVKYVSWGHLLITENKLYHNINFTVKTYDATYVASLIKFFVSESSQDIANKLNKQLVNLDPGFWMNKNLQNYETTMNAVLVKENLLTKYEIQYVHWNSFQIAAAKYYWNKAIFAVWKTNPAYEASGKVSLNVTKETSAQIATKLAKANLKLNWNNWEWRFITDQGKGYDPSYTILFHQLCNIILNEHILTKAELSTVKAFHTAKVGYHIAKEGLYNISFDINNDNKYVVSHTHLQVVKDGNSAKQIATEATKNLSEWMLKTNTIGKYADSEYVLQNFRSLLVNFGGVKADDTKYITLPHVKLQHDQSLSAIVYKDGEFAATNNIKLNTYTDIYWLSRWNNYMKVYINLKPEIIQTLKSYFPSHSSKDDLGYFYNMLCDGNDDELASYDATSYIPWGHRLNDNLYTYGDCVMTQDDIIEHQSRTDAHGTGSPGTEQNNAFENALYGEVMKSNGYLSLMFEWHYEYNQPGSDADLYTINQYKFW